MRLFYSAASPYARKVLIAAHETGLIDRIEVVSAPSSPTSRHPDVARHNPLGKIPALELGDGTNLYDSRVIVEHLDLLAGGGRLVPADHSRIRVLTGQALADGILDAALLVRYELTLRPESLRWPDWIDGQYTKIDAGLDALEANVSEFGNRFMIDAIAAASALGYLDYRFADRPWRSARPQLASWFDAVAARPSLAATAPAG